MDRQHENGQRAIFLDWRVAIGLVASGVALVVVAGLLRLLAPSLVPVPALTLAVVTGQLCISAFGFLTAVNKPTRLKVAPIVIGISILLTAVIVVGEQFGVISSRIFLVRVGLIVLGLAAASAVWVRLRTDPAFPA